MIYNLVEYLKTTFPAEKIYTNVMSQEAIQALIPDRVLIIRESGGPEGAWVHYAQKTVQVLARDLDSPKARALAWLIYNELHGRFGLILPTVTVDSVVFSQIQSAQTSGIQQPYCLGSDTEGRTLFTTNYKIIYER